LEREVPDQPHVMGKIKQWIKRNQPQPFLKRIT
jgi:hypothetical protein